jgi:hypothetical protein
MDELLYLLVDSELLGFVVDAVDFPEGIERRERGANITVLVGVQGLIAHKTMRVLAKQLHDLNVLMYKEWVGAEEGEELIANWKADPLNCIYRYVVVTATTHSDFLGFGGVFVGESSARYRIVRIAEEDADWQIGRLASGMKLVQGGANFSSFADASAYVAELEGAN